MTQSTAGMPHGKTTEEQARLHLQGLQHEVERSTELVRRLKWLAILLVALLVVLLISLHLYHVMQYAKVSMVEAAAVDGRPESAEIRYTPESSGKIEFVRESEGLSQTLTEYAKVGGSSPSSAKIFTWSGKPGDNSAFRVTYRSGLFLVTDELPLSKSGGKN
jgi:hypothetical protein